MKDRPERCVKIDFGCGELTEGKLERYSRYLGCYNPDEYIKVDARSVHGVDIVYRGGGSLPFQSDYVDEIVCIHVLEHILDYQPLMKEFHRILKPGGKLRIWVPHCWSAVAFRMPTHFRYFTYNTFVPFDASNEFNYEFGFSFKFIMSHMQIFRRSYTPNFLDRVFERVVNSYQVYGERLLKILPYKEWEVYTELQKAP